MWSSAVAVAGTLLGGTLTALLQARSARAARREARADQRRDDQVKAVTSLVQALNDHRRAMWLREDLRLGGADQQTLSSARDALHATRSDVSATLASVAVLVPELREAAQSAAGTTFALRDAADRDALTALRRTAIAAVDAFVDAAGVFFATPVS